MTFWPITPTRSTHFSHVAPFIGLVMFVQEGGGGDVIAKYVVHPWHLWDQGCEGIFIGVEQEFGDLGGSKTWWHFPTFRVIMTCHAFNLGCWEWSIIPTQSTCDHENMGGKDWPNGYRRWGAWCTTVITGFHWMFCLQFEGIGSIKRIRDLNHIEGW